MVVPDAEATRVAVSVPLASLVTDSSAAVLAVAVSVVPALGREVAQAVSALVVSDRVGSMPAGAGIPRADQPLPSSRW